MDTDDPTSEALGREAELDEPEPIFAVRWRGQPPAELLAQAGQWVEQQDPVTAFRYYEAALVVDGTYGAAAWYAARLAVRTHRYAYAAEKAVLAVCLSPDHQPSYHLASVACLHAGQHERALEFADATLARNSVHPAASVHKLRCLAALRRWEEMDRHYRTLGPDHLAAGEVHLWQALALAHLGDLDAGRALYARVPSRTRRRFPDAVREIEAAIDV